MQAKVQELLDFQHQVLIRTKIIFNYFTDNIFLILCTREMISVF